jgi:hypothetical protein
MEMGRSVYTVVGERIEEFTVQKLLGNTNDDFHEMYKHKEQTFLYRPEVTELEKISQFNCNRVWNTERPRRLRAQTRLRESVLKQLFNNDLGGYCLPSKKEGKKEERRVKSREFSLCSE